MLRTSNLTVLRTKQCFTLKNDSSLKFEDKSERFFSGFFPSQKIWSVFSGCPPFTRLYGGGGRYNELNLYLELVGRAQQVIWDGTTPPCPQPLASAFQEFAYTVGELKTSNTQSERNGEGTRYTHGEMWLKESISNRISIENMISIKWGCRRPSVGPLDELRDCKNYAD